jgi:hypothetical protein
MYIYVCVYGYVDVRVWIGIDVYGSSLVHNLFTYCPQPIHIWANIIKSELREGQHRFLSFGFCDLFIAYLGTGMDRDWIDSSCTLVH